MCVSWSMNKVSHVCPIMMFGWFHNAHHPNLPGLSYSTNQVMWSWFPGAWSCWRTLAAVGSKNGHIATQSAPSNGTVDLWWFPSRMSLFLATSRILNTTWHKVHWLTVCSRCCFVERFWREFEMIHIKILKLLLAITSHDIRRWFVLFVMHALCVRISFSLCKRDEQGWEFFLPTDPTDL